MKKDIHRFWILFTSTLYLSSLTFGGGYVIVPLMKKKFVEDLNWIEEKEMLDLTAISQAAPGAIAVNTSIIVGYRVAGLWGALIATLGTMLPPLIIISILSIFYSAFKDYVLVKSLLRGMQAGVAAVLADVVLGMASGILKEKKTSSVFIMIGAFCTVFFFKINVAYIIVISGLIGFFTCLYGETKRKGREHP
jgi:chromate transporter